MNNDVLDTYQLKSLDGLFESDLKHIVIVQGGGEKTGKKFYLTSEKYLANVKGKNSSDVMRDMQKGHLHKNTFWEKPYDRVIRCTGFQFNFSIFDRYRQLGQMSNLMHWISSFTFLIWCLPFFLNKST